MSESPLSDYLTRPMTPPAADTLEAIASGPIAAKDALALEDVDRLLDPTLLEHETGWCALPDGVAYVAVRTPMPRVTGEMVDWWFDWHPRDPLRYRVWHPLAHSDNSLDGNPSADTGGEGEDGLYVSPKGVTRARVREERLTPRARTREGGGGPTPRAKAHWGATHHPVEDVGTGMVHARIEFLPPTAMGMTTDALDDPQVATIVCGYAGDDRLHVRHSPMFHVFLRDGEGVVLRSRFWLGAALRPVWPARRDRREAAQQTHGAQACAAQTAATRACHALCGGVHQPGGAATGVVPAVWTGGGVVPIGPDSFAVVSMPADRLDELQPVWRAL